MCSSDLPVYEQYVQVILGRSVVKPEIEVYVYGTVNEELMTLQKDEVAHFYHSGRTNLCLRRIELEEEE